MSSAKILLGFILLTSLLFDFAVNILFKPYDILRLEANHDFVADGHGRRFSRIRFFPLAAYFFSDKMKPIWLIFL